MRGFDAEDVEVIRKAVESDGVDSKACAPGPPMDERVEEDPPDEDSGKDSEDVHVSDLFFSQD